MKELKNGNQIIGVKASPLALLFYKQEFKSDLLMDMNSMKSGQKVNFDSIVIYQIAWALNRCYMLPKKISPFETWLGDFEAIDPEFFSGVAEEAQNLFVKDKPGPAPKKK